MARRSRIRPGACAVLVFAAALSAHAGVACATTISTCLARKLDAVGRSVATRTACYARDAAKPDPAALAACLEKPTQHFTGGSDAATGQFEKLERIWLCLTTDDQAAQEAAIDGFVADLDDLVANPGSPSGCDAAKLKCVGKYGKGTLGCHARAAMRTGVVDARCIMRQSLRLSDGARGCLERAEAAAKACTVTGDAADLEDAADAFIGATVCALDPVSSLSCNGAPTPTPHAPTATPRPATATASPNVATPTALVGTATRTPTPTASRSTTPTPSPVRTATATPSRTATRTPTPIRTATATPSRTPTATPTPTRTATRTPSRTPTPTRTASRTPTSTPTPNPNDVAQLCVDEINRHRASVGLGPLARWSAAESCVNGQCLQDSQSGRPHGAFGQCGEYAQNECPGWPGPPSQMIVSCLQAMWNEGPGDDYATHGHYINMTNPNHSMVACGFHVLSNGTVWAAQDFR